MSEFDVTSFVSTPRSDVLKILVLQRRNYLLDLLDDSFAEHYRLYNSPKSLSVVKGAFVGLIFEIYVMLENYIIFLQNHKHKDSPEFKTVVDLIKQIEQTKNVTNLIPLIVFVEKVLYAKHITKFDNKEKLNYRNIEQVNRSDGYD